jgi:hypothetical protein
MRCTVLEREERADHVQVERGAHRLDVGEDERAHVQRPTSRRHDTVQPTGFVDGLGHGGLDLRLDRDVGDDRVDARTLDGIPDARGGRVELVGRASADRDDRAVTSQRERAPLTDAAPPTGDEHAKAFKSTGHRSPS